MNPELEGRLEPAAALAELAAIKISSLKDAAPQTRNAKLTRTRSATCLDLGVQLGRGVLTAPDAVEARIDTVGSRCRVRNVGQPPVASGSRPLADQIAHAGIQFLVSQGEYLPLLVVPVQTGPDLKRNFMLLRVCVEKDHRVADAVSLPFFPFDADAEHYEERCHGQDGGYCEAKVQSGERNAIKHFAPDYLLRIEQQIIQPP